MGRLRLDPARFPGELSQLQQQLALSSAQLPAAETLPIGASARRCLLSRERMHLYHYAARSAEARRDEQPLKTPVLIVYALVNRPYVLDLLPGHSLIEGLLAEGVDVYLLDWGRPQAGDRNLGLADYLLDYLQRAVDTVCESQGSDQLNLLGICQGGTLSLCYAALRPQRVRNLLCVSAPVDFHVDDFALSNLVGRLNVAALEARYEQIPGDWLRQFFVTMKPLALGLKKYLDLADLAGRDDALRLFAAMEQWIGDSPDLAARACGEFMRACFQENRLVRGGLSIAGESVDLRQIRQPVLNVHAARDHLVPPASSQAMQDLLGSTDYEEANWDTGHIGIYVSRRAVDGVPAKVADWLRERD